MTAKQLREAARLAIARGDYAEARELNAQAMELEREAGKEQVRKPKRAA